MFDEKFLKRILKIVVFSLRCLCVLSVVSITSVHDVFAIRGETNFPYFATAKSAELTPRAIQTSDSDLWFDETSVNLGLDPSTTIKSQNGWSSLSVQQKMFCYLVMYWVCVLVLSIVIYLKVIYG